MVIAFFHSHKFRFDGKHYYSTGGLSDLVLQKYIGPSDQINVYARITPKGENENLGAIEDSRVKIIDYATVKVTQVINHSDICIMRVPSPIGFKACRVARKLEKPYLVEVVGCAWDAYWNYGLKGKFVALPAYLIMRDCVRKSKFTTYVTQEFLQKRYPCGGKSVGISDVEMPLPDNGILQKRLTHISEKNAKKVIGTIAAVDVSYKGQDSVIRALAILKKQGFCNFEYRLIGGGNPEHLKKVADENGVSEQVIFLGAKPHDEVFTLLDDLDVYMQPSRQEGLCRALLEAMSRGCPAIASDVGGNGELVEQELLYKSNRNDDHSIAHMLLSFSSSEKLRECARRNFEYARRYDPQVLQLRWREFYQVFISALK